jgi:FKBP-type peptidyl-prolyl cis-trans isomerase 2
VSERERGREREGEREREREREGERERANDNGTLASYRSRYITVDANEWLAGRVVRKNSGRA